MYLNLAGNDKVSKPFGLGVVKPGQTLPCVVKPSSCGSKVVDPQTSSLYPNARKLRFNACYFFSFLQECVELFSLGLRWETLISWEFPPTHRFHTTTSSDTTTNHRPRYCFHPLGYDTTSTSNYHKPHRPRYCLF